MWICSESSKYSRGAAAKPPRGMEEMKYLAQAILIDNTGINTVETVVDSFRTDDYNATFDFLMKRHRNSTSYLYKAIEIETQEVVASTTQNKFGW